MDLLLKNKVVFVTGASGGIGRALAEAFAAEGAQLALHGNRHFGELETWLAGQPWKERALAVRAETTQRVEVEEAVQAAASRFGRVDVCVANAGAWPPGELALSHSPEDRIQDTVDTNLMGSVWTAKAFLQALEAAGPRDDGHGASLILIGSTAGRFGEKGHAEYAVAKAGLYGLVTTLKNEIVDIDPFGRVNMIEPGWTATHMARPALQQPGNIARAARTMAVRQIGRAADIARAALFFASPQMARHVSGQVLTVAGGMEGRVLWETDSIDEDAIRERLRDGD
jgi:3-oxoacyl-[acyl-carrier protein] reductase